MKINRDILNLKNEIKYLKFKKIETHSNIYEKRITNGVKNIFLFIF